MIEVRAGVSVFAFAFLLSLFMNREWSFYLPSIFLFFLFFLKRDSWLLLLGVGYLILVVFGDRVREVYLGAEWNGWLLSSFMYSWVFIVLGYYLSKEMKTDLFLKLVLIAGAFVVIYFLYGILFLGDVRGIGVLRKPIVKGNIVTYIAILSLLSFIYFRNAGNFKMVYFSSIIFVGALFLSVVIGTRGGWLAFLLVFLTIAVFYIKCFDKKVFSVLFASVFLVVVAFVFDIGGASQRGGAIFDNINKCLIEGDCHSSVGYRIWLWKSAIKALFDVSFQIPVIDMSEFLIKMGMPEIFPHFHNDFINLIMFTGVLGVLVFFAFFVFPVVYVLKKVSFCDRGSKSFVLFIFLLSTVEAFFDFSLSDTVLGQRYLLSVYFLFASFFIFKIVRVKN